LQERGIKRGWEDDLSLQVHVVAGAGRGNAAPRDPRAPWLPEPISDRDCPCLTP